MLRVLQQMGYSADVAGNGLEVLETLNNQHYDIVFMDVEMPEMDGLEATRAIAKRLPAQSRPAIIGTTAYAMEDDRASCLEAGMNDYISKPIRIEEIQRALERWGGMKLAQTDPVKNISEPDTIIDSNRISEIVRMGGLSDPGLLANLIDLYLEDFLHAVAEMKQHAQNKDIFGVIKATHRLKGSSLNLGVRYVADVCKRIEAKGQDNEPDEMLALVEQLDKNYEAISAELRRFKN